jgi:hypothetical protein
MHFHQIIKFKAMSKIKMSKSVDILAQIMAFRGKPNSGIIKIILKDGSTVIGLYKNVDDQKGYVELSNGRIVLFKEIERII